MAHNVSVESPDEYFDDDCVSTSTLLSPSNDPELYFDNWSVCSEDNCMLQLDAASPTVTRFSHRATQMPSTSANTATTPSPDTNESVIDRIKRRSYYCRFNENKPKRTSSIVGTNAVREYYQVSNKARCSTRSLQKHATTNKQGNGRNRNLSPDITQEFFRPLKLSPIGTELKPPPYTSKVGGGSSSNFIDKPRKSLNDIRLTERTTSSALLPSTRLYSSSALLSAASANSSHQRSSPYENFPEGSSTITPNYYSTYNSKASTNSNEDGIGANCSSALNGYHRHSSNALDLCKHRSSIDGYATLGRSKQLRAYNNHRTLSLLESSGDYQTARDPGGSLSRREYTPSR